MSRGFYTLPSGHECLHVYIHTCTSIWYMCVQRQHLSFRQVRFKFFKVVQEPRRCLPAEPGLSLSLMCLFWHLTITMKWFRSNTWTPSSNVGALHNRWAVFPIWKLGENTFENLKWQRAKRPLVKQDKRSAFRRSAKMKLHALRKLKWQIEISSRNRIAKSGFCGSFRTFSLK